MRAVELVRDAGRAMFRRLARNILTVAALALGIGTIVVVLGISQSSAAQIANRLDALAGGAAQVTIADGAWLRSDRDLLREARTAQLIDTLGTFQPLTGVDTPPVSALLGGPSVTATVVIATPEGLAARAATVIEGGVVLDELTAHGARAAAIGESLARQLGLDLEDGRATVQFGVNTLVVTAILRDNARDSLLANALVLSPSTAEVLELRPSSQQLLATSDNTANALTNFLPLVLSPAQPSSVSISVAPQAEGLRGDISSDTRNFVLVIAITTAVMSGIGILTIMQIAVRERRSEIGILRAMGMPRSKVAWKFMLESLIAGVLGATAGWVLGVLVAASLVTFSGSQFVIPPLVWFIPALGLAVGIAGGLVPAVRASRLEPLALIRSQE